jgi:hypothetical protein
MLMFLVSHRPRLVAYSTDHVGFLRRINKLLFHGIKPVFVFDGGAPVLKRSTIVSRFQRSNRRLTG